MNVYPSQEIAELCAEIGQLKRDLATARRDEAEAMRERAAEVVSTLRDAWRNPLQRAGVAYAESILAAIRALELPPATEPCLAIQEAAIRANEREKIAQQLETEADALPCTEDAAVTRSNAQLVRAHFSYTEAFDGKPPPSADVQDASGGRG